MLSRHYAKLLALAVIFPRHMKVLTKYIVILFSIVGCNEKVNKETIKVDGQTINATTETEDNYNYKLSNLSQEQTEDLSQNLAMAKKVVSKYCRDRIDKPFDSQTLDLVLEHWRLSKIKDEKLEEMIDAIGAAFGQGIVDELNFEWKIITDQYGTDLTVIHKKYVINGFPYSSVQKILTEDNPRSLNEIKLILKSQIEVAENGGKVDIR
jgi:hypothetical protein